MSNAVRMRGVGGTVITCPAHLAPKMAAAGYQRIDVPETAVQTPRRRTRKRAAEKTQPKLDGS